jgi:hypothetical protein
MVKRVVNTLTGAYDEGGAWPSGKSWERATAKRRRGGRACGCSGSSSAAGVAAAGAEVERPH